MDWKSVISTVAPWIGTALGGPLGGMAMEAAATALGAKESTASALKQAFSGATPDQMMALKKADQEFAVQMQTLGYKQISDLEAIAAGDRANARQLQSSNKSKVPAILTVFIVVCFAGTLLLLLKHDVPTVNRDIIVYMIGQLSGGFTSALAFWLGTTRQSENKTDILAKNLNT